MATYHCSVKVMKRSSGRSATAAAAYRSGSSIECEREGRTHEYTKKQDVDAAFIMSPDNAPDWASDRSAVWNRAELSEKRKDAQVAREVEVALPREIPKEAQEALVRDFVKDNFIERGMIADVAIHRPPASDGQEQPHAHIMLTMRPLDGQEFAAKKDRSWNDKQLVEDWREAWAQKVNQALEKANIKERVDHRSYGRQGKEEAATKHLGPAAHAMEKRGIKTARGDYNRMIRKINMAVRLAQKQVGLMANTVKYLLEPKAKKFEIPAPTPVKTASQRMVEEAEIAAAQTEYERPEAKKPTFKEEAAELDKQLRSRPPRKPTLEEEMQALDKQLRSRPEKAKEQKQPRVRRRRKSRGIER